MSEVKFVQGLSFKAKHANAPDYVICKGSIRKDDLIAWLQTELGEWINFDVKESKGGKYYASVDDWKPNQGGGHGGRKGGQEPRQRQAPVTNPVNDEFGDSIPF